MERAQLIDLIVRMRPEYCREKLGKLAAVKGNKALEIVLDTIRLSDKHRDDFRAAPPVKAPRPAVIYKHKVCQLAAQFSARLQVEEVHELVVCQGPGETESVAYEQAAEDMEAGLTDCDYAHSADCREWAGVDEHGNPVIEAEQAAEDVSPGSSRLLEE